MDHRLTPKALKNLAQELVDPSETFEPFVPGQNLSTTEKLTVLGHLEPLTQESLNGPREELKKVELAKQLMAAKNHAQQRAKVQAKQMAERSKPAYQKALANPDVVHALVSLTQNYDKPAFKRKLSSPAIIKGKK